MLKRFLAFHDDQYYPSGGMGGFIGDFDTYEEAINALENAPQESMYIDSIFDCLLRKEVYNK